MIGIGGIVKIMWTLEQAIEDTERAYKESRNGLQYALKRGETKFAERCKKDAEEFGQLTEWLRELQERRKEPEIIRCSECVYFKDLAVTVGYCKKKVMYQFKDYFCKDAIHKDTDGKELNE